ncbi:unnamed protein product [Litomosoides sigmodontis]|uniref:Uncharacterized protein n=1 Tax=Litomosoides sigmodontis TaxID=42156 RepID=A0A3P6VA90_LITSI|nr:unnamed protein product [Litomosoides sigmodontis]
MSARFVAVVATSQVDKEAALANHWPLKVEFVHFRAEILMTEKFKSLCEYQQLSSVIRFVVGYGVQCC